MSTQTNRGNRIAGLRAYADLLEANPEIPAPEFIATYLPATEEARTLRIVAVHAFCREMPALAISATGGTLYLSSRMHGLKIRMATELAGIGEKTRIVKQVDKWSFPDLPFLPSQECVS